MTSMTERYLGPGGSYEDAYLHDIFDDSPPQPTPEEEYDAAYHDPDGFRQAVRRCKCGHPRWHHGVFFTSCGRAGCGCRKYIEYYHAKEGIYD